jgi:hypothetical protein
MKFLVMKCSPTAYYFTPLRCKYSPQRPVLNSKSSFTIIHTNLFYANYAVEKASLNRFRDNMDLKIGLTISILYIYTSSMRLESKWTRGWNYNFSGAECVTTFYVVKTIW